MIARFWSRLKYPQVHRGKSCLISFIEGAAKRLHTSVNAIHATTANNRPCEIIKIRFRKYGCGDPERTWTALCGCRPLSARVLGHRELCSAQIEPTMSNVLRNNFFTVSWALIDAGHARGLSGSAVKLYLVLMRLAQKHSAVKIELPAYRARDLAGLTAETVSNARKALEAAGLVTSRKGEHGVTVYELLDPETKAPLPRPARHSGFYRHSATPGRSARKARKQIYAIQSSETIAPSWDAIGTIETTTRKRTTDNPIAHTEVSNGDSVSMKRQIREHSTENPLRPTTEAPEIAQLSASLRSIKTSLKTEFSEQREVSIKTVSGEKGNSLSSENELVSEGDPNLEFLVCYACSERKRTPVWFRRPSGDYFCASCLSGRV